MDIWPCVQATWVLDELMSQFFKDQIKINRKSWHVNEYRKAPCRLLIFVAQNVKLRK